MPTFIAGKDNKVLFGAFDLSSFFNTANFSREQEAVETTTFNGCRMGSDWAYYRILSYSWGGSSRFKFEKHSLERTNGLFG